MSNMLSPTWLHTKAGKALPPYVGGYDMGLHHMLRGDSFPTKHNIEVRHLIEISQKDAISISSAIPMRLMLVLHIYDLHHTFKHFVITINI